MADVKVTKKQALELIAAKEQELKGIAEEFNIPEDTFEFENLKGKTLDALKEYYSKLCAYAVKFENGGATEESTSSTETIEGTPVEQFEPSVVETAKAEKVPENEETRLVNIGSLTNSVSGTLWHQTGIVIHGSSRLFDRPDMEPKELQKNFISLLDSKVDKAIIPEKGKGRDGEEITLRKKDGKVKWSSWEVTARIVQNCSTIFKGISLLGYDVVLPYGVLIPRSQLDKLLKEVDSDKPGEAPEDTVKRCLELAAKKMDQVESIEALLEIDQFVQYTLEQFSKRIGELKAEAQKAELVEA